MSEQKQKMYAPEEIPKYLRRKGVNVPLPERKERKKREPKAKVSKTVPETDKTELNNNFVADSSANKEGSMLDAAGSTLVERDSSTLTVVEQPTPEVPTDALPPVVKPNRKSKEPLKTKTLRGPRVAKVESKTRAPNPWQIHLQDYRAKNPNISYKQCMADARASYVKV